MLQRGSHQSSQTNPRIHPSWLCQFPCDFHKRYRTSDSEPAPARLFPSSHFCMISVACPDLMRRRRECITPLGDFKPDWKSWLALNRFLLRGKINCTVTFESCLLWVPLIYQFCSFVPCCQGKLNTLLKNSEQNLLYSSFMSLSRLLRTSCISDIQNLKMLSLIWRVEFLQCAASKYEHDKRHSSATPLRSDITAQRRLLSQISLIANKGMLWQNYLRCIPTSK